jgi:hypothetical protein
MVTERMVTERMVTLHPADRAQVILHPAEKMVLTVPISGFHAHVSGPAQILAEVAALFPCTGSSSGGRAGETLPKALFEIEQDATDPSTFRLIDGGRVRWVGLQQDALVAFLEWVIIDAAVGWLGTRYQLFHAGAVARNSQGILLPAVSGQGKTTLTAALIAEGFRLCSDEVGMLDLETNRLIPFPRSLRLRAHSHQVLASSYPGLLDHAICRNRGIEPIWYFRPTAEVWSDAPVPVRAVVFPGYLPGAKTTIERITRAVALPLLLDHALSARWLRQLGMERAVEILQRSDCYTMTVGDDLATAVGHLRSLSD